MSTGKGRIGGHLGKQGGEARWVAGLWALPATVAVAVVARGKRWLAVAGLKILSRNGPGVFGGPNPAVTAHGSTSLRSPHPAVSPTYCVSRPAVSPARSVSQ